MTEKQFVQAVKIYDRLRELKKEIQSLQQNKNEKIFRIIIEFEKKGTLITEYFTGKSTENILNALINDKKDQLKPMEAQFDAI